MLGEIRHAQYAECTAGQPVGDERCPRITSTVSVARVAVLVDARWSAGFLCSRGRTASATGVSGGGTGGASRKSHHDRAARRHLPRHRRVGRPTQR